MPGSTKTEREIYEHYLITKLGLPGTPGTLNKRMPMGGRIDEYNRRINQVLKDYNLPTFE